ncbi:MAG: hypothetical protein AAGC60_23795 [Acidobacteriota bacterium]
MIRNETPRLLLLGACAALLLMAGSAWAASSPAERAAQAVPVYLVEAHWLAEGAALDVAVSVDGSIIHREQIELLEPSAAASGGTLAIELLAAAPSSRSWLDAFASSSSVQVGLAVGDLEIDRLDWGQLLEQGRSIDFEALQPIRVVTESAPASRLTAGLAGVPTKARNLIACIDDCEDDWMSCGHSNPSCQDGFLSCVSRCGILNPCLPGTDVTETATPMGGRTAVVPATYSCTNYFGSGSAPPFHLYQLHGTRYKITTTTETTTLRCGGSTNTVVDYEYRFTCWILEQLFSCAGYPAEATPAHSLLLCG